VLTKPTQPTTSRIADGRHEFGGTPREVKAASDRNFGIVFAAAFTALAIYNAWHGGKLWPWGGVVAAVFLVVALVRPSLLALPNRLWIKLGMALGRIVTPIVLGGLFFLVVTPVALLGRAFGKEFLKLRPEPDAQSYWIVRRPPGPAPESMLDQF
jgi:hypothetical protein